MKKLTYNFLIWCAGSDKNILNECPRHEQIKHAGYGTMVLIPATVAFCSMSYAISTFVPDKPTIFYSLATCWALIVFCLDRFILLSFRKSDSLIRDVFSASALLRIFLAGFLGLVVAHPVVLLVFKESIDEKLVEIRGNQTLEVRDKYESKKKGFEFKNEKLRKELESKEDDLACLRKLLTYEQSGQKIELPCGASSGYVKYGVRAKKIQEQIKAVDAEYKSLAAKHSLAEERNLGEIVDLDNLMREELEKLDKNFSTGYTARDIALRELEKEYPITVGRAKTAIILLFVLLDIIAVSFKVTTKAGPYDRVIALDQETQISYSKYATWRQQHIEEDAEEAKLKAMMVKKLLEIRKSRFETIVKEWGTSDDAKIPDLLDKLKEVVGFRYLSSMFYDSAPFTVRFRQKVSRFFEIDFFGNIFIGFLVGLMVLFAFLKNGNLNEALVPLACYPLVQITYDKALKLANNRGLL